MEKNEPDRRLVEWLSQVVITTAGLMEPLGLRVLVPSAERVPSSLAKLLIAASVPNTLSYAIWTTLNIAGSALQHLSRSFMSPPSVDTLTLAITEAIANGDLRVCAKAPVSVDDDGNINQEFWITANR